MDGGETGLLLPAEDGVILNEQLMEVIGRRPLDNAQGNFPECQGKQRGEREEQEIAYPWVASKRCSDIPYLETT